MTGSLKERMRFFKLRTVHNAPLISVTFNKQFQPEIIPAQNDPFQIEWIDSTCTEEVFVGEAVRTMFGPAHPDF
jgi:actin-related protein 8